MNKNSNKNIKCISNSYKKGEWIIHPLILLPITNQDTDFCLTLPYINSDNERSYLIK
mgnify:CR=1 FL=1